MGLIQTGDAQHRGQASGMERLINSYLDSYPFHSDNEFKLAAYAELRGTYSARDRAFVLPFGDLADLAFYPHNCLLKVNRQVFYLDIGDDDPAKIRAFNRALEEVFENISLMGNHGATPEHIRFVNRWLAKKSIEPFDKIFTRHILLKYGKYDSRMRQVVFHTNWIAGKDIAYRGSGDKQLVRKPTTPLKMVLDSINLRGWYLKVGGYVYVEDVRRPVAYATGEQYSYNLSAFKLFVQKMFVQTAQEVVAEEARRPKPMLTKVSRRKQIQARTEVMDRPRPMAHHTRGEGPPVSKHRQVPAPLYHDKAWIPMMLSMLREKNIRVTDPAVLQHLINKPFFKDVYQYLSAEERALVDRYNWQRNVTED